jgi:hypothetical protein
MVGGVFARLLSMVLGMDVMTMRDVGMVMRLLMIAGGVMLGSGAMVLRGVLVVFSSFQMMLFSFFRHGFSFQEIEIFGFPILTSRIRGACESAITRM